MNHNNNKSCGNCNSNCALWNCFMHLTFFPPIYPARDQLKPLIRAIYSFTAACFLSFMKCMKKNPKMGGSRETVGVPPGLFLSSSLACSSSIHQPLTPQPCGTAPFDREKKLPLEHEWFSFCHPSPNFRINRKKNICGG